MLIGAKENTEWTGIPYEAAGLLISNVSLNERWLTFGTRFGGGDFNKGRVNFVLPYPQELFPILQACITGRAEGPLLRQRRVFNGRRKPLAIESLDHLRSLYDEWLLRAPRKSVETEQDRKEVFRRLLRRIGGVSEDEMAREFKQLVHSAEVKKNLSVRDLRHAVSTEMKLAGLSVLELRYFTSHTTNDILNDYIPLDPHGEMKKYFDAVRPLIEALAERSRQLGLTGVTTLA
jgi:hypothetical protein